MAIDGRTVDEIFQQMRARLARVVPEFELRHKAALVLEINRLKRARNAVILGHNYMEPALYHTVPDHVGDSLELSRVAARTDADVIVFCGVRFMAETAKILSSDKTVLLPAEKAGCSLAASITAADVRALRERYPGVPVVCYVNTYADVKAESDACCTSSNAAAVVSSFDSDTVIFVPDEYLARNVARQTGKRIVIARGSGDSAERLARGGHNDAADRHHVGAGSRGDHGAALEVAEIVGWAGRCEVHEKFTLADVRRIRRQFPEVIVLAHPECPPEVVEAADYSGSTTAMADYVRHSDAPQYLLLTECAMGDNIAAENPDKQMLRLCSVRCPHMNEITLEGVLRSLREDRQTIEVPEPIRRRARRAIERMLSIRGPRALTAGAR